MATLLKSSVARRVRRALGSLFEEARRLERRRRFRYAARALIAAGVAAGGAVLIVDGSSTRSPGAESHPVPFFSSATLPQKGDYFALAAVNNRIVVSGGPTGSLLPSGSATSLAHDRAVGTCDAATVNTRTLKLGHVTHANCGDPALYGEQVLAISYLIHPTSQTHGIGVFAVRIAHADAHALDGYTLGPVVGSYQQCSDCSAEWVYGDHSLWIYGVHEGRLGDGPGELLRSSDATGKVAQRWTFQTGVRELLAADNDGLWFAPSIETGTALHPTRTQRTDAESLYHVAPGASEPTRELTIGSADWLVAAGQTAWLETRTVTGRERIKSTLLRVTRPSGKAAALGSYKHPFDQTVDIGANPITHVGNGKLGIFYVNLPQSTSLPNSSEQIMRLDPSAPKQTVIVKDVRPADTSDMIGLPGAALGRSVYFLDPQQLDYLGGRKAPAVQGQAVLYRLTPRSR
jgi:hypothetical protein